MASNASRRPMLTSHATQYRLVDEGRPPQGARYNRTADRDRFKSAIREESHRRIGERHDRMVHFSKDGHVLVSKSPGRRKAVIERPPFGTTHISPPSLPGGCERRAAGRPS